MNTKNKNSLEDFKVEFEISYQSTTYDKTRT